MLGLTTWLLDTMARVDPSLGERTSCVVPVMPPAPGRFSITRGWPSALASGTPSERASASTLEPAAFGMIILTGLSPWAREGMQGSTRDRPMAASTARRLVEMRVFIECLLWFYGI